MTEIIHKGPERSSATLMQAKELLSAIASGLTTNAEFELSYEKCETGSVLKLTTCRPAVEVIDGVSVDSANKAAIDVDSAAVVDSKSKKRNGKDTDPGTIGS